MIDDAQNTLAYQQRVVRDDQPQLRGHPRPSPDVNPGRRVPTGGGGVPAAPAGSGRRARFLSPVVDGRTVETMGEGAGLQRLGVAGIALAVRAVWLRRRWVAMIPLALIVAVGTATTVLSLA